MNRLTLSLAALSLGVTMVSAPARAQNDDPLNAAGPVGVSSGHKAAVNGFWFGATTIITAGALMAILVDDKGTSGTSTSSTATATATATAY